MLNIRFAATEDGSLTPEQRHAYETQGVLVLEDYVTRDETRALREATARLVEDFDPAAVRTVFSTSSRAHAADEYFQTSGDKVRFFLEAGAMDDEGRLTVPKERALNKIGHAAHDLDPDFARFSRTAKLARTARDVGLADPGLVQSMVIFKQPRIGGEVGMHQDATFLHTEPVSCVGFWFALEDATVDNGCLFGLPGLKGRGLAERFRYEDGAEGETLAMEPLSDEAMPMDDAVPLEAPEGSLVLLHGLFPHASHPNTSGRSRLAYALHMIDRRARWSADNWLRRAPDMPVRGFPPFEGDAA